MHAMTDVTQILSQIEEGDPKAAEQLLPLVYEELRKLAAQKMAQENPGQTLQATALVHEAYLRLVDNEKAQHWNSRGHFFGNDLCLRSITIGNFLDPPNSQKGGRGRLPRLPQVGPGADWGRPMPANPMRLSAGTTPAARSNGPSSSAPAN
jgi:RNA polymerase sigma factor (TIGR02999 family)